MKFTHGILGICAGLIPFFSYPSVSASTVNDSGVHRAATPKEWQEMYFRGRSVDTINKGAHGVFRRTSDNLDLLKYRQSEIAFGCHHVINKQTKVIVLPYGTFIRD